jgi:hypothetical protein
MNRAALIAVALFALAFVVMALGGCSGLKMDGACTYTRQVTTSYQCPAEGQLQHFRVAPGGPEP